MPDIKISDLTAATSASGAQQLEVNDSGTSKRITVDQIKAYVVSAGSINATALGTDAVTNVKIQNGAVTPAKLSTGGLYWDASGNVGIGTTSPGSRLDVNGSATFRAGIVNKNTATAGTGYTYFDIGTDTDGAVRSAISCAFAGNSSNLSFSTSNAGTRLERLVIRGDGNIGIGADPGGWKLNVAGNILSTYQQVDNGTTNQYVGMSLANRYTGGTGTSFIDSQGRNSVTDSHIFFNHYADNGSEIVIATQTPGTNTDRRQNRLAINPYGAFAIGGSNGASGQVLTSRGDTDTPVWANPTVPTTYGAIGSYVIAAENDYTANQERLPDGTVSGSSLVRTTENGNATTARGLNGINVHVWSGAATSLGLSGTWRRMTRGRTASAAGYSPLILYVRIS